MKRNIKKVEILKMVGVRTKMIAGILAVCVCLSPKLTDAEVITIEPSGNATKTNHPPVVSSPSNQDGSMSPTPSSGSSDQQSIVNAVQTYLNQLKSLKANFTQMASTGESSSGVFYLQRPGKFRFEYRSPKKLVLLSDGSTLIEYDPEMGQASRASLSESPAAEFLTQQHIHLGGTVNILKAENDGSTIVLQMADSSLQDVGSIEMRFQANPMVLKSWTITDAGGGQVTVKLSGLQANPSLKKDLFSFLSHEWEQWQKKNE